MIFIRRQPTFHSGVRKYLLHAVPCICAEKKKGLTGHTESTEITEKPQKGRLLVLEGSVASLCIPCILCERKDLTERPQKGRQLVIEGSVDSQCIRRSLCGRKDLSASSEIAEIIRIR